jgi:hypothetical protein
MAAGQTRVGRDAMPNNRVQPTRHKPRAADAGALCCQAMHYKGALGEQKWQKPKGQNGRLSKYGVN